MPKTSNSLAVESCSELLRFSPQYLVDNAPLESLDIQLLSRAEIGVHVLRLDALDLNVSGNKIFKLYNHLSYYSKNNFKCPIASFGGPWSNHLHALAAMGKALSIPTLGIIRGEEVDNPTIADLRKFGMALHFVSRADYRQRRSNAWIQQLERLFGRVYWVPEGGGGSLGAIGCAAIGAGIVTRMPTVNCIALACGTGTTLAGVIHGVNSMDTNAKIHIEGFSALKGCKQALLADVAELLKGLGQPGVNITWQINDDFHYGGFAKYPPKLRNFVDQFEPLLRISLDPVYTAKLFYGIVQRAQVGFWPAGTQIVAVHSGGLQGRRGYYPETLSE